MKPILYIRGVDNAMGAFSQTKDLQASADFCSVYDIASHHLADYQALLIPAHIDQKALQKQSSSLQSFLDQGGIFVINGHIVYPFLKELQVFEPLAERHLEDLRITRLAEHEIFSGVDVDDLTFRRGVAGFYGRGHNPMPNGALAIHGIGRAQQPLDWLYEHSNGGCILMHSSNDIWMHAADDTSANRIAPQLLSWLLSRGGRTA